MSIRLLVLYVSVVGLSIYAWKDWFKSLCGLILLMASIEHGDMPKGMFGIHGLNTWNVLFGMIFLAWAVNRRREGLKWDLGPRVTVLLFLYAGVIVVGVLRAVFDRSHIEGYPYGTRGLLAEELVNTIKWVLPGLLLFDGCRTRKQVVQALTCLLVMYMLLSLQVVRCMPPEAALSSSGAIDRSRMKLDDDVGYAATDLSVMLAGACWGTVAALPLVRKRWHKAVVLVGASSIAFGQALTGGRGGYIAWGAAGLVLCLIKWRKYLILAPVVVVLLPVVLPGATARMLEGFGHVDVSGQTTLDEDITSGRTLIWPYVIDKIGASPVIGHGRLGMTRSGLQEFLLHEYGPSEAVPHPHNMYLETLLDNGVLGSLPIWLFWATAMLYSARLFRSANRLYSAVGGLSLALTLTSLISGIAGQHFYPQEHTLGIWVATCLSLRVYVEDRRVQMDMTGAEEYWNQPVSLDDQEVAVPART